jgi:hypothetical protein
MSCFRPLILLAALLVASCGGGDSRDTLSSSAPSSAPARAPSNAAADNTAIFEWVETHYPQYFNGAHVDGMQVVAGYGTFAYRFWPATGNYVGMLDGLVYVYGPVSAYAIQLVGLPPFLIQGTSPADGATGVSRTAGFAATLTAPASAPTVTSSSVTLKGPQGNVIAANVTSSGAGVTLMPAEGALPGDTTYTVSFAPTIVDTTGRTLTGTRTKTFTTSPQVWGATVTDVADTPVGWDEKEPAIAYDASGNILVALNLRGHLTGDTLYVNQLNVAIGTWSAPVALEVLADGQISGLNMSCGKLGDCYLTWNRFGPVNGNYETTTRIARFDGSSSTWGAPSTVPYGGLATPYFDSSGNMTLLIRTTSEIVALPLNASATAWGSPNRFTFTGSPVILPQAVMDAAGNIAVVWVHEGPSTRWVYGSRYNAATGVWSAEQPIADQLNTTANSPLWLAVDGAGAATVAFARGGFIAEVYAARLEPATGLWGASIRLDNVDPDRDFAMYPNVIADAAGYATAIWTQWGGLWTSRYSPGAGIWSAPQAMPAGCSGGVEGTLLAVDIAGNVTALWSSGFGVGACRWLVKDGAWGPATDINVPTAGSVIFTSRTMRMATSPTGNLAATWYQQNGSDTGPGVQLHKLVLNTLH